MEEKETVRTEWSIETVTDDVFSMPQRRETSEEVATEGYTFASPPLETRKDKQPCEYIDDLWVLITSGDMFDVWDAGIAEGEIVEDEHNGVESRMFEDVARHLILGTEMSQAVKNKHIATFARIDARRVRIDKKPQ